jgi:hypothetical protein
MVWAKLWRFTGKLFCFFIFLKVVFGLMENRKKMEIPYVKEKK